MISMFVKCLILSSLLLPQWNVAVAQPSAASSGTLNYDFVISMPGDSAAGMVEQVQPMIIALDGNRSVMYMNVDQMGEVRIIKDVSAGETTALISNGKKKYYATAGDEEIRKIREEDKRAQDSTLNILGSHDGDPSTVFVKLDTTIMVEGMRCSLYEKGNDLISVKILASEDVNIPSSLFDFGTPLSGQSDFSMDEIKGFPLGFEMRMDFLGLVMSIAMNLKSVELNKADHELFRIPKGYKKVSFRELMEMEMN